MRKVCAREVCSAEFETYDNRKIYCTRSCAVTVNNSRYPKRKAKPKAESKSGLQKWLDGEWDGTVKDGLSRPIRDYLIKMANYRCQDGRSGCNNWSGFNPVSGRTCLTVDHVDGNPYNNVRENLVVMCPNCHSMTETYGALNKGSGRKFRYAVVTQLVE